MKTSPSRNASHIVAITNAAKMLGYARETLSKYITDDGCPTTQSPSGARRGTTHVDLVQVHRWLLSRAKGSDESPLFRERLAKTIAEREKIEISNREKMGELLPKDDVAAVFAEAQVSLRNELDATASRIAKGDAKLRRKLLGETRKIQANYVRRLEGYMQDVIASGQTGKGTSA